MNKFKAIQSDAVILTLINDDNIAAVRQMLQKFPDAEYMLAELEKSYRPRYDESGRRTKYGFYAHFEEELAGMTLLGICSWKNCRGYTGADILTHMRGKGIAPSAKPLLFYLAFEFLGLNRVETGCFVSNISSKKSIEKTPGFRPEGIVREFALNSRGEFEDEYRFAIIKKDWLKIRQNYNIRIVY